MIRRFKMWLYGRFLPSVTKDLYLNDMQNLLKANAAQKAEIAELRAYARGMQQALRARIIIKNEVKHDKEN